MNHIVIVGFFGGAPERRCKLECCNDIKTSIRKKGLETVGITSSLSSSIALVFPCVTVKHALSPKNAMSQMVFDPGTSHIESHCSTN
jgi:hypothetical protein